MTNSQIIEFINTNKHQGRIQTMWKLWFQKVKLS